MTEIIWTIGYVIGALLLLPFAAVIVVGLVGLLVLLFVWAFVAIAERMERGR